MFPLNPIGSLKYCTENYNSVGRVFQDIAFNKTKAFMKCAAKGLVPGYEMNKSDKRKIWNLIDEGNKIFNCN